MFDVCTIRHTSHIEAIVQFLPYSAQQVRCDGLHNRGNSVLQIRYAHGLWWHKHCVLRVTCSFVPCGKLTSACVLKVVMAGLIHSNHFDTRCVCVKPVSDREFLRSTSIVKIPFTCKNEIIISKT